VARNSALQVGYVGNVGIHSDHYVRHQPDPRKWLRNCSIYGSSSQGATPSYDVLRPTPNFGRINYFSRDGHSNYHALQVQFRSKLKPTSPTSRQPILGRTR